MCIRDSPNVRFKIAAEGQRYAARFSDEAMAEGTMRTYERAMADFRRP